MQGFFPLVYGVQSYDWGKIGSDSLVYQLSRKSGLIKEDIPSKPFAELWMGDHPSLPSCVKFPNGEQKLSNLLSENPEQVLGKAYSKFGTKKLPFLFKVLSVNKVLSLQVHPSKEIAKDLHKNFPEIYKDDNHKPEMAIALSEFHAMCNFRPYEEIVKMFEEVPILLEFIGKDLVEQFRNCSENERKDKLQLIFKEFFNKDKTQIEQAIEKLIAKVSSVEEKSPRDHLVLKLQNQFPNDIGILISYLLNYLIIQPGEAFVMDPCEPHAYVFGNCLEGNSLSVCDSDSL